MWIYKNHFLDMTIKRHNKEIICGIYKITSPTNRIYIGQSVDIYNRWISYKYFYEESKESLIFKSIKKYGYESHNFEIVEECNNNLLSEREIYWIEFFKCNVSKYRNDIGMNLTAGGNKPPTIYGRFVTDDMKQSISEKNKQNHIDGKYKKLSKKIKQFNVDGTFIKCWESIKCVVEENNNIGYAGLTNCCMGKTSMYKGYIWRYEFDDLLKYPIYCKWYKSKCHKQPKIKNKPHFNCGRKMSDETKQKQSESAKKSWTDERRIQQSNVMKNRENYWLKGLTQTSEQVEMRIHKLRKPIIQLDLNMNIIKIWSCMAEIVKELNFCDDLIRNVCNNKRDSYKNFIWKWKK